MSDRRKFLKHVARGAALLGVVGAISILRTPSEGKPHRPSSLVWQIDPKKCIGCGKCEKCCVLNISAVKCYHDYARCGYCDICTGYFELEPIAFNTGGENQICPTAAIQRTFVEAPYYEYVIDRDLCVGCGKCVEGCTNYGNGSLYLQIDQSLCVQCNQCAIAINCPSQAITRVGE